MHRQILVSALSVGIAIATVLAHPAEAQRGGPRGGDDNDGGRRGQFGGGRGGGFRGGPGGGGSSLLGLLRVNEVQEEIQLTVDQQELVEILGEELREGRPDFPENFRDLSEEEQAAFRRRMEDWSQEQSTQATETLRTILEEQQYKRLQEISIQTRGVSALLDEEVAEKVELSEEQLAKLKETQDAAREEMGTAMREMFRGGGGGFDRDAMREKMEEFRKETENRMLAHLSEEQKAAFADLKGKPFEMPERRAGFGGGGRGGDGRGRGGNRPRRPE